MISSVFRKLTLVSVTFAGTLVLLSASIHAGTPEWKADPENQAFGITPNFGKWTDGQITWVYNPTGAPAGYTDDATTVARFQAAMEEWGGICDVTFTYAGVDPTATTDSNDGIVTMAWGNLNGAAGLAGPLSASTTETSLGRWDYIDGSVQMDIATFAFAGGTPSEQTRNELSFHAVAVHELGHLIGLGHSDRPDSIMYADPYNSITHLEEDDREACRAIYGYADVNAPREIYTPPAAGTNTYDFLFLTVFSDVTYTPITSDDGAPPADTETLAIRYQTGIPPFPRTLTAAYVDPDGYLATIGEFEIPFGSFGAFGVASFGLLRENPGRWTVYVYDSTGLVATLPFDVNVSLPSTNAPPDATFTFSEDPSTRAVSVTTNVTNDTEEDNATIIWHIPGSAPITVNLGIPPGNDNRNVTFTNGLDNEIFVEVNDDAPRYTGVAPGTGPAGPGFHRLFRYLSSRNNAGPDMDGDNSSDILWRNSVTGVNWLYSLNGNLIRESQLVNVEGDSAWQIVGLADFNGDGKTDILWRNSTTGVNWMYLMDGETIVSSSIVNVEGKQEWRVASTGDYDGDGSADILWRHDVTGDMYIYFMDGATIDSVGFVGQESDPNWQIVGNGDYNGDGRSDILWRNTVNGRNWMYLMNGATPTSLPVNTVGKQSWRVVGSGDYNGDGNSDILWRNYTLTQGGATGRNWVYLMNGNLIDQSLLINHEGDLNWEVVGSGDYNQDGRSDILWRHSTRGLNWMYQMNGNLIEETVILNKETDFDWEIVNLH